MDMTQVFISLHYIPSSWETRGYEREISWDNPTPCRGPRHIETIPTRDATCAQPDRALICPSFSTSLLSQVTTDALYHCRLAPVDCAMLAMRVAGVHVSPAYGFASIRHHNLSHPSISPLRVAFKGAWASLMV